MTRAGGVRRLGAAAIDLAFVAAGRFDGFWERGLKSWDMAAGRAAGPRGRRLRHRLPTAEQTMLTSGGVCAGNEFIHRQLLDLLKKV